MMRPKQVHWLILTFDPSIERSRANDTKPIAPYGHQMATKTSD